MTSLTLKVLKWTGLFALLYFLCVGLGVLVGHFFDNAGNMLYAPVFAAVFGGSVYMLLQSKIKKFGAISLVGIIMGGFFLLSGHFMIAGLPGLVFGLLADTIAGLGKYENKFLNLLSFVCFSFVNSGPIILMWLARQAYIDSLVARGKTAEYINRILLPLDFPTIASFIVMVVAGALIGGLLGQYLVKKRSAKAASQS